MNSTAPSGGIDRLRAVTLAVTDLAHSLEFYTGVWGLVLVEKNNGSAWLRASGLDHHILVLQQADKPGLVSMTWGTPTVDALQALYKRLVEKDVPTEEPPRKLGSQGGGWGFAFRDPDGRTHKVVAEREDHCAALPSKEVPTRLAHVVVNTADAAGMTSFFQDVVGFRVSDQTAKMSFLRCSPNHHSIAFSDDGNVSLNHVAFEMKSWNELMFGVGRMKLAGNSIHWGVGRHGPGDNVFAYFLDPDGLVVEYNAEMQQINEATHVAGRPDQWKRPPERMDQWGHSDLPSDAIKLAMHGYPTPQKKTVTS
jgi:catechol-2,3-dioxygenase